MKISINEAKHFIKPTRRQIEFLQDYSCMSDKEIENLSRKEATEIINEIMDSWGE